MRLNFSGVDDDRIREGIRRIGEVIGEQVELFGTLTGERPPDARTTAKPEPDADLADVLHLPKPDDRRGRNSG
jgi:2-aminoadipate transaminase